MEFLRGKTAIVTGAAGGIGEAICKKLASLGTNLVVIGRKAQALEDLAAQLPAKVHCCVGDLQELSFVDRLLAETREVFGGVDVIINNAGLSHNCTVEEMTPEVFDSIMQVNVRAPYFMCQKALGDLKKSDCATIINICSVVAHKGYPKQSVYAASKHALLGVSKSMANEWYKENIRVHVISPGSVFTPMIAMVRPDLTPEGMILPEDIADIMGFYLEMRKTNCVVDEIEAHRVTKEPFA
jgi:NAD(P)-dependent dehydrogenase (short-subunit alcohol dehydrogenase family)